MCLVPDATASSDSNDAPPEGDGIGQGRLRRAAPLAALSARTAGEALALGLRKRLTGADAVEFHVRTAARYAELLGSSKGALMKIGQMLSFIPAGTLVPAELQAIYQTALARLQADAPPMAPVLARETLERELGQRVESAYARFDWTPFAAASVGQVHAAQLHDGRAVAVKIQYPGVAAAIDADLRNHELLATFLDLVSGLSPKKTSFDARAVAREMNAHIAQELDYRLEAANQTQFADIYRGHPFIHVPAVIGELSTRRVLTQELAHGKSWNEALTAEQELRDSWAEAIHRFSYGSYDRFFLFNADPHPGNYLFHDDGGVSFLDFGSVKRVERDHVRTMNSILRACWSHDVRGTWRASVEAGFWRSSDPVTPDEVFTFWREDWAILCSDQRFTVTPEYVTRWATRRFSPNGPLANAIRYASVPPELALIGRMEIGVASLIAQLYASNHWGLITAERFGCAAPFTVMGKLEHAFFAARRAAGSPPARGR
jgi:predicted unusual protein kinase regulating ubiquinone biosynthesis (AarF/ABC1/UbiB family)